MNYNRKFRTSKLRTLRIKLIMFVICESWYPLPSLRGYTRFETAQSHIYHFYSRSPIRANTERIDLKLKRPLLLQQSYIFNVSFYFIARHRSTQISAFCSVSNSLSPSASTPIPFRINISNRCLQIAARVDFPPTHIPIDAASRDKITLIHFQIELICKTTLQISWNFPFSNSNLR